MLKQQQEGLFSKKMIVFCAVSLLNIVLKIFKRFLHENLTNYVAHFFQNLFPLIASPKVQIMY